jgi:hypothetical protein
VLPVPHADAIALAMSQAARLSVRSWTASASQKVGAVSASGLWQPIDANRLKQPIWQVSAMKCIYTLRVAEGNCIRVVFEQMHQCWSGDRLNLRR